MSPDEFERMLRATLAERAQEAPDPDQLSQRVLTAVELNASADAAARAEDWEPAHRTVGAARPGRVVVGGAHRFQQRRFSRLLVPLASAACIAAVVGLGLVVTHDDRSTSDRASSGAAAEGQTETIITAAATSGATQSVPVTESDNSGGAAGPGGGSPTKVQNSTSSSTPSSSASAAAASASAAAVRSSFEVTDLSFDSPTSGFALGTVLCGDSRCSALAHSSDPSKWMLVSSKLPFAVGPVIAGQANVAHIRFASSTVGYAYGTHALYTTDDGGVTWTDANTSALALEVDGDSVVRVAQGDCATTCAYSLSTAKTGSSDFTEVAVPGAPLRGTTAVLTRSGAHVYLAVQSETGDGDAFLSSSDGGQTWIQNDQDLCGGEAGNSTPAQVDSLSAAPDGSVTALCSAADVQYTITSADSGATFTVGSPITSGPVTSVAALSSQLLVVSGSSLSRSTDGGQTWSAAQTLEPSATTLFVGFQSSVAGRWVSQTGSSLWTTLDAGSTYTEYAFS
ncbi:MAG: hypothetical protein JWM76_923 [Pseudonocardiales bacterium]|nr:hypothetical protein [Pseudonocardiales bacterium]